MSDTPDDMLDEFGLDKEKWSLVSARKSTWQSGNGDWLEARRVSLAKSHPEAVALTINVKE